MIYYLNLFFLFFLFSKLNNKLLFNREIIWFLSLLSLFLILGSRYYIGGDYFGYMNLYNKMDYANFKYSFYQTEILYYSILLLSNKLELGYYFTNFVLMFIIIFFFQYYAKRFKNPFYIFLIALPILFIPISINFVRQAIAISIFLYAIKYLVERKFFKYLFFVIIASLFHKFALIYLFFYLAYEKNFKKNMKNILLMLFFTISISIFAYFSKDNILSIWMDKFIWHLNIYSDINYPILPKGSIFRLGMITLSFLILIYFKKYFKNYGEYKLWMAIGLLSFLMIPLSFIYPLLVSRIIIFFLPITIFVFGNIIFIQKYRNLFSINLMSLFFLIYFLVWFNFSPFKSFFSPYKSIFFL